MAKGTVNKVIILGRLGKDPEIKATNSGTQVSNLSIATTEIGPKDQSGQRTTTTEWHNCVVFGKTAENAAAYLRKGSQVYLEGRLQTRKWQDKNTGQDRYATELICNEMQFIGGGNNASTQPRAPKQSFGNQPQQPQQIEGTGFDDFDDDIPF